MVHKTEWSEDEPRSPFAQLPGSRFDYGWSRFKDDILRHRTARLLDIGALRYVAARLEAKRYFIPPVGDLADGHRTSRGINKGVSVKQTWLDQTRFPSYTETQRTVPGMASTVVQVTEIGQFPSAILRPLYGPHLSSPLVQ